MGPTAVTLSEMQFHLHVFGGRERAFPMLLRDFDGGLWQILQSAEHNARRPRASGLAHGEPDRAFVLGEGRILKAIRAFESVFALPIHAVRGVERGTDILMCCFV